VKSQGIDDSDLWSGLSLVARSALKCGGLPPLCAGQLAGRALAVRLGREQARWRKAAAPLPHSIKMQSVLGSLSLS
jgi:hypothetical protein